MPLTPVGLRMKAYSYHRLSEMQTAAEGRHRMAAAALALAQLAEQIERGTLWTAAQIDLFEHELTALPEQESSDIRRFLDEQRARLATPEPGWWRDHTPILDSLLNEAIAVTGADMGNIQIFNADARALTIAASRGFDAPFLTYFATVHDDGASACGTAIAQGARIIVPDVAASDIFAGKQSGKVMLDAGARAVQSTPIVGRTGQLVAMISTHWHTVSTFADDQQKNLDRLIERAAREIETLAIRYSGPTSNSRR